MVLVFKTNLTDERCIKRVEKLFNQFEKPFEWSVDTEDCDNVLRVVTETIGKKKIIQTVRRAGFECEELA